MTNRRQFMACLLATGFAQTTSWADVGTPTYLGAAENSDGSYVLCGITAEIAIVFRVPLPARGHAAAAHPSKPEAVAFARRPGTFAVVIDCRSGQTKAKLETSNGRHFYGHGIFSSDGSRLYTTENDYITGQGRVGVWDATNNYRRIGEFTSGGIGPHEIKRLPNSDTLVVANGGIETHPETGRMKLNIPTMRPNLAYIDDGQVVETAELPPALHKNSIRHIAVANTGKVVFGMQWQGIGMPPALIGTHERNETCKLLDEGLELGHMMQGYVGSVAISDNGAVIAATSPRGGLTAAFSSKSAEPTVYSLPDVSGVAFANGKMLVSSGNGKLGFLNAKTPPVSTALRWDNHLVTIRN